MHVRTRLPTCSSKWTLCHYVFVVVVVLPLLVMPLPSLDQVYLVDCCVPNILCRFQHTVGA